MYASGKPHPLKAPCDEILQLITLAPHRAVTDVEVFQEILHRFKSLRRWPQDKPAFDRFATAMAGRIEPIYFADVVAAVELADAYPTLSARDLLHLAVMRRTGITHIISADADFDRVAGMVRLDPAAFPAWRHLLQP